MDAGEFVGVEMRWFGDGMVHAEEGIGRMVKRRQPDDK